MKTNLSRRVAITGLCAVVAVPVTVQAASADAELLRLGAEMDRLEVMWADARERAEPNWRAWKGVLADFGERHKNNPGLHITNEEYFAEGDRVDREHPIAFPHPDDVTDMIDEPARRIMALPATTLAGLAVKARLVRSHCDEMWEQPDDNADWEHLVIRSLVDAVLRLAVQA